MPVPKPPPIPCKLGTGPWEYDASGKIDDVVNGALNGFTAKFDEKIKKVSDIRDAATRLWDGLKATATPESMIHVQLRPQAVNAGPIDSSPTSTPGMYTITSAVEIVGRPRLVFGPPPEPDTTPLPDLGTSVSGKKGFDLGVDLEMPFDQATRLIAAKFPYTFRFGNHELVLCNPVRRPSGTKVSLEVEFYSQVNETHPPENGLGGKIKSFFRAIRVAIEDELWTSYAKVYLTGTPQFDVLRRDLYFPDLDFTVESKSVLIKGLDWIFHTVLVDDLRALSRLNFGERIDQVYPVLNAAMNRSLGPAELTGYTDLVRPDSIWVSEKATVARMRAMGSLSLKVSAKLP